LCGAESGEFPTQHRQNVRSVAMTLGVIWHAWIGVVLFFGGVLTVLATVVGYLVKVQSLKYPKRQR
jgi:hypothetical protein